MAWITKYYFVAQLDSSYIYALLGFYVINLPAKTAAKRKEATISFQKTSILFVQALLYVRIYSRKHVFQPQ